MKKKKLSALLLAFAMLLSLLPMGALAQEQSVTAWGELVAAMETGGNVVLGASLEAPSTDQVLVVPEDKTVTLDLNGFTIDGSALRHTDVVIVEGQLTLKDSSENQAGMITGNGQDVAYVENSGSFTVEGGKIINTNSKGLGAVYVRVSGTFTVSGAPVIEGGVYLPSGNDGNHSSITIGGELAEETLIRVKMVTPGVFTSGLSGKGTAANFASLNEGYTVILDNGEAKLAKVDPGPAVLPDPHWAELQDALSQDGTVKLTQNYTATSVNEPLVIHAKNNKMGTLDVTLDLNGFTIDGSALASYDVLQVYGRLTLTDSSESGNGKIIADGEDDKIGYVIKIDGNRGRFTMTGGAITANGCEGAVDVQEDHQFTMTGGTITANGCEGAVFVDEKCTFSLSGDPVINGGVYLDEGSVITIAGPLTNPAPIGVSVRTWDDEADAYVGVPGVFTSGWRTNMEGKDPAVYFTSDHSFAVILDENGEAMMKMKPIMAFSAAAEKGLGGVTTTAGEKPLWGDEITVTASAQPGWTFLGWFKGHWDKDDWVDDVVDPVCDTLDYTFIITEDTELLAKYEARGTATVTVETENDAEYTASVDGSLQEKPLNITLGKTLTLTARDADKVLQWQNGSGKVLGTGGTLIIPVTGNMTVKLVYKPKEGAEQSFVQFVSDYGQVLAARTYTTTEAITFPTVPSKLGYTFQKWVFDGTEVEATAGAIKEKLGKESVITVKPSYTQSDTTTCTVTVSYSYNGEQLGNVAYEGITLGDGYTVTVPEIPGYRFHHWANSAGTILGYKNSYFLQVTGDVTLTAHYVGENTQVEVKPVIAIDPLSRTLEQDVMKVVGSVTRSIPEGYTLVEHGVLYAKDFNEPTALNFVYGGENISKYISTTTGMNGVVRLFVKVDNEDTIVTFRGYMILKDNKTGNEAVYYTDLASRSYSKPNS